MQRSIGVVAGILSIAGAVWAFRWVAAAEERGVVSEIHREGATERPMTDCRPTPVQLVQQRARDLDSLRSILEPSPTARYQRWSAEGVERMFEEVAAADTLDLVDCSEIPCIALYLGVDHPTIEQRIRARAGFEGSLVGGRGLSETEERPEAALVVLWEEPPTPEERVRAEARTTSILERFKSVDR